MKKFILLLAGILLASNIWADDITFKASAPKAVAMGNQFQLTFSVNTTNNISGRDLRVPQAVSENFDVLFGPSVSRSHSTQIINGKSSSSSTTTFTYVLVGKKEGTFEIEPAALKVGNSEYKSNSLTIKVLPADQASQAQQQSSAQQQQSNERTATSGNVGNDQLFVRAIVSNRNVYEQEGFLVTFKLYTAVDIAGVNNIKLPEFEGFHTQDIENDNVQWVLENYNGRNYNTAIIKQSVLYPQRSGELTVGSAKIEAIVRVLNRSSRPRSFFDDFFDTYQDVPKTITSQPFTINVKPLPTGKPSSFSGAVGNFTMKADINKTNVKTNEAITIKLTISGNGNIKLLKNPEVKFPNDFEVYDPKVDNNIKVSAAGSNGTKTIEYMAIPRYAGNFEIPAINFSYFDTKSGSYKTLSTESYKIHVEKGEGDAESPAVVSNYTNRESIKQLGSDIHYIKTDTAKFLPNKDIFFGSFMHIMIYLIIALLSIAFFIIYRKQLKENSNIALVRTKKANKTAVKRLKQAEKLLKENKEEPFYEEVLRALWGYLSDKLSIPQAELTKENVETELAKYGVDETLSKEFLDIINTCEFARYAPSRSSGAMDKLFKETVDAIGKMENTIKK